MNTGDLEGKVVTADNYVYDMNVLTEEYARNVLDTDIQTDVLEINLHRGAAGFVKCSVIGPSPDGSEDKDAVEVSTTGWKKNMILDCGLDKIAHMSWAQAFQFCMAGTTTDTAAVQATETTLKDPHSINSFWMTGHPHTGTEITGNTIKLRRTFDFYKVFCPTVITEIGFKESPGARKLFSRILLDPPQQLHAGQFLRVEYLLQVVMAPWGSTLSAAQYGNLDTNDPSTASISDRADTSNPLYSYGFPASGTPGNTTTVPVISNWSTSADDLHLLQLVGMAGVDPEDGMAKPIDKAGFCNEPFAPGTCSFGPGYGYPNRWRNGGAVTYQRNSTLAQMGFDGGATSVGYLSGSPYTEVGPLYDYTDVTYVTAGAYPVDGPFGNLALSGWGAGNSTTPPTSNVDLNLIDGFVPDVTTQAKVYRNPHEWLNYIISVNNDGRVDREGNLTKGALYMRTTGESDFETNTYNSVLTSDYRSYLYFNYWQPGTMENLGQHHGYISDPLANVVDTPVRNQNAFDVVVGHDIFNQIRYFKSIYYYDPNSQGKEEAQIHKGVANTGKNLNKDLAGSGPDITQWQYESVYESLFGMTGPSSFENLTHLWDPVVKFNTGRGSYPNQIYTHYTNRNASGTKMLGRSAGSDPDHFVGYSSAYFPEPESQSDQIGKETWNKQGYDYKALPGAGTKPDYWDPRISWYHAHYMNFFDPAQGAPAINQHQCGSARVFLSGYWHSFCPGTRIVTGPGQVGTLPVAWCSSTGDPTGHSVYTNNLTAFEEKGFIPYVLGLSGELIPVPEPNPNAHQITNTSFHRNCGNFQGDAKVHGCDSYGYWPDWNRDIPYKDDFVAGSSCFLSTMSAPPTASFGTSTRWTLPHADEWDGYIQTNAYTVSATNWREQLYEGSNPNYHAFVSQVSSTTLNRWDGTTGSWGGYAHDSDRGPYNDGLQTSVSAVELPLRLEPYTPGSKKRVKYAVFEPSVGNGTWNSVGVGPTSKAIIANRAGTRQTSNMWEAATYPGYVYTFSGSRNSGTQSLTGNIKLDTHQLKLAFIYTWDRLTSYGAA